MHKNTTPKVVVQSNIHCINNEKVTHNVLQPDKFFLHTIMFYSFIYFILF
jgi:hypothetical protein